MTKVPLGALALLVALIFGAAASAAAQDPPRVSVQLNTGLAKLGETVGILVHMEGTTEGSIGDLPDVPGLSIGPIPGGRTSRQATSINGRMSVQSSISWTIPVRASAEGEYVIPPFLVTAAGNDYETNPMPLRVKEDLAGAELGIVQVKITPKKVVLGQPFDVEVSFGWDTAVRKLNHADLSLPWWGQIPGAIEMEGSGRRELGKSYTSVLLNSRSQIEVTREGAGSIRGRSFEMFSLRRSYLATSPGLIEFPASHLKFGQMLGGGFLDPAREGDMYYTKAEPVSLVVGTLPETGRPRDYLDAVGSITARAEIDRREVNAGDSIKLRVEWTGQGNLEFFALPDATHLDGMENINFYGVTDELKERNRRVSVFDFAPLSEAVKELPSIPLVVYNPETEAYERVVTQPMPIRVHALEGTGSLDVEELPELEEDIRDLRSEIPASPSRGGDGLEPDPHFLRKFGGALALLGAAWAGLRVAVRRNGDPATPGNRRRRAAHRNLRRALRRSDSASARQQAFGAFLSARSGEGEGAWIGRDLQPILVAYPAMAKVALAMAELDSAVWSSGSGHQASDGELLALARTVESLDLEVAANTLQGESR